MVSATHLGHELHQTANMDHDMKCKRARFIENSTEIRETFSFAEPSLILQAVRLYTGHYYGSMTWDLQSEIAGQLFRSWNTCVKLAFDVPRSTHVYLVQNVLADEFLPIETELMARYVKFYESLTNSQSFEVKVLSQIAVQDKRSTTSRNISLIEKKTGKCSLLLTPN